jgi:hypothetical protein
MLAQDVGVRCSGALQDVKRVVGSVRCMERCARSRPRAHRAQERQICERIPRALEEQPRCRHALQVLGVFGIGAAGRVQRETKEHQSANSYDGVCVT